MNIGTIVTPNTKGQIVIPKKMRDKLNITKNTSLNVVDDGRMIYIHPVKEVSTASEFDNSTFLEILKMTQGAWAEDDWPKTRRRRRRIELAASKRRKSAW